MKTKRTPWFPGHVKPIRKGVYEWPRILRSKPRFAYWDGRQWRDWAFSVSFAVHRFSMGRIARDQDEQWRGLATPPKERR